MSCEELGFYAFLYADGWLGMCEEFDLWEGCPASCGVCGDGPATAPEPTVIFRCNDVFGNEEWIANGLCDSNNNNPACDYDGGDCCPSDCDPGSLYGCDFISPSCEDCVDPESGDNLPGGECYE